jgi:hypothetical protein
MRTFPHRFNPAAQAGQPFEENLQSNLVGKHDTVVVRERRHHQAAAIVDPPLKKYTNWTGGVGYGLRHLVEDALTIWSHFEMPSSRPNFEE